MNVNGNRREEEREEENIKRDDERERIENVVVTIGLSEDGRSDGRWSRPFFLWISASLFDILFQYDPLLSLILCSFLFGVLLLLLLPSLSSPPLRFPFMYSPPSAVQYRSSDASFPFFSVSPLIFQYVFFIPPFLISESYFYFSSSFFTHLHLVTSFSSFVNAGWG